jgi:Acetyltransferase (GNAT) domain
MAISVRQADLDGDRRELLDTLQTNLPHLPHERFFEWLYQRNPEGKAVVWVATEPDSGRMVGMAAAFPRRVYCSGTEAKGYVLGDFCVASNYRSLGLALTLQRACMEGLAACGARFALDFPSDGMLAVYRRLRVGTAQTMTRHAKPLDAGRKVGQRVTVGVLAKGLTALANGGLRLRDAGTRRRTDWKIAVEAGPWGEEFTRAAREWSPAC